MARKYIIVLLAFSALNFKALAQPGLGISGGLVQSITLHQRDSFQGSPGYYLGLAGYLPIGKGHLALGMQYHMVNEAVKLDATNIRWQSLNARAGFEWPIKGMSGAAFYYGWQSTYMLAFGKTFTSGANSSGTEFKKLDNPDKWAHAPEFGLVFKPKPAIRVALTLAIPLNQSGTDNQYRYPGSLKLGIEYRIDREVISRIQKDTFSYDRKFARNLKNGTLYFIEDRSDSSHQLFRKNVAQFYTYSKAGFVSGKHLSAFVDSIAKTADSASVYYVKAGTIVYESNRAATCGLIVYDYRMLDPVPGSPFFIRNLTVDVDFEEDEIVRKAVKTLNKKLQKTYNMYRPK